MMKTESQLQFYSETSITHFTKEISKEREMTFEHFGKLINDLLIR